ncbi:replication initiator [Micropruina sonneratiae]|uniref:replication initiator n=1 Tax=Micropruina sonneratiae TaxID=2986940 RepID=UPI0022262D6E|nr:replication initiator [Micropruina sp. KQZ13P-5]MCW3157921.1 replication initiation protein [Micropruina sp. KQZ13P-5]
MLATVGQITAGMARELAEAEGVCARPLLRRVTDRETGAVSRVALACGSTREAVCPACAGKARRLRMQQCTEGWHRTDEPEADTGGITDNAAPGDTGSISDNTDPDTGGITPGRRVRSTKRRQDVPDLPHVPMSDRTVGVVFSGRDGKEHRPSMFITLTLPSYGAIHDGAPVTPATYDYRRTALDAMLFPRLLDQFWKTLRRTAGFNLQYFSAIEPQRRLAPHLHAAIRGVIPRKVLRQVVTATYLQVWWPAFDHAIYVDELPRWTGTDYADPRTGELLPTWEESLDAIDIDPDAAPAHVMRFGSQLDAQGIVRGQPDADRAIRYLTKYLTKDVVGTNDDDQEARRRAHIDRLHLELRYLPCSERCANWLRYGIQPKHAGPHLAPGFCNGKAHRREHLGLGGRRVLVSRKWSSKTLARHRADRAEVVREALESAGLVAPDVERLSASVTTTDGRARFVWEQIEGDHTTYAEVVMLAVAERRRWRTEYEAAREVQQGRSAMPP